MPLERSRSSGSKASKPRTEAQKLRRKELWLAREADRQTAAETRCLARYDELKVEMARHGQVIGSLADALAIEDPDHRFEVVKARVERWDAQWSIALRKRDTRGKIVLGGAILAELAALDLTDKADRAFHSRLVDLIDRQVLRVRDRLLLRDLITGATTVETPLPLRPGGELGEALADALAAVGAPLAEIEADAFESEAELAGEV